MARSRRYSKNRKTTRRGKTRRQTQRGAGGCFGGICKPNKAANMKVEQPGQKPEEVINFTNPLHIEAFAKKQAANLAAAEAELAKAMKKSNNASKALSKPLSGVMSNAEALEELRKLGFNNGAGTGLEPGEEVSLNDINLGKMTNEEFSAYMNRITGSKRKTRKNHRGGGGCFGGICGPNKKMIEQVTQPGTAPVTMVENPIQTKSRLERAQELYAKGRERLATFDAIIQAKVAEKAKYESMISRAKNQTTKDKIIAIINALDEQINQANLAKTKLEINLMTLGSVPKGAFKNRRR